MQERRTIIAPISADQIPSSATEITKGQTATGNVFYIPVMSEMNNTIKIDFKYKNEDSIAMLLFGHFLEYLTAYYLGDTRGYYPFCFGLTSDEFLLGYTKDKSSFDALNATGIIMNSAAVFVKDDGTVEDASEGGSSGIIGYIKVETLKYDYYNDVILGRKNGTCSIVGSYNDGITVYVDTE